MSEVSAVESTKRPKVHYNGRFTQMLVYLGKQLRFFINMSDWKVLPMAAIIAGLVAMVIRKRFFINMEGGLIGGFALTCVAIWNGCFNSIQTVCRERAIVKREHRSGLHISAYVAAHMIYQFMLCLAQTVLTVYVMKSVGVQFPEKGFMTPWMMLDIGISMLLISYAADMMSLFLSSLARTTTGAMTLMPFVLIFQLVFSGGIIPLPAWSQTLSNFTISNYGIRAIAAQSGYNELPMVTVWNAVSGMKDNEIGGTITLGEVLDALDHPAVENMRDREIVKSYTVGEVADILKSGDEYLHLTDIKVTDTFTPREIINLILTNDALKSIRDYEIFPAWDENTPATTVGSLLKDISENEDLQELLETKLGKTITLGQVLDALHAEDLLNKVSDQKLNESVTVGKIVDFIKNNETLQNQRDRSNTIKFTVGDILNLFGEENVKNIIQEKTAAAARKPEYERTEQNIVRNWLILGGFALVFALLATIVLELIDKDKR